MWRSLDASAVGLVLAFATAACGVAVFVYTAPDAGRVASWLPWLYVAASIAVGNLARWLASSPN